MPEATQRYAKLLTLMPFSLSKLKSMPASMRRSLEWPLIASYLLKSLDTQWEIRNWTARCRCLVAPYHARRRAWSRSEWSCYYWRYSWSGSTRIPGWIHAYRLVIHHVVGRRVGSVPWKLGVLSLSSNTIEMQLKVPTSLDIFVISSYRLFA